MYIYIEREKESVSQRERERVKAGERDRGKFEGRGHIPLLLCPPLADRRLIGTALSLRTTTLQKCEAVPRRART